MRKILNETDRITQENRPPSGQLPPACSRVECGEKFVLYEHIGTRQTIHQSAFPCIGVTDQRNRSVFSTGRNRSLFPSLNHRQFAPQITNFFFDQAAVHFQLLFTRTPHPDTAFDSRKVGPHLLEPGERIFKLRKFHRKACFACAGPMGKNIQNQFSPVDDFYAERFFQIARLRRTQVIIEEHDIRTTLLDKQLQRLEFAFT